METQTEPHVSRRKKVRLKIAAECEKVALFSLLLKDLIRTDGDGDYDHTTHMRVLIPHLEERLKVISDLEDEYEADEEDAIDSIRLVK